MLRSRWSAIGRAYTIVCVNRKDDDLDGGGDDAALELRTLATGLDHPEDVCWDPEGGVVYAGGEAGQLYRLTLDGAKPPETIARVEGGFILGMALDGAGALYACDSGHGVVQRIERGGEAAPFGQRMTYPNYPAFDADGHLWVSDSGSWGRRDGWIHRVGPDGMADVPPRGPFSFPNGLAVTDQWLYFVESATSSVLRLPLKGGAAEPVVTIPQTVPDGLAFDAEGGLWISCYQPNRVYRLDPGGELELPIDDWTGQQAMTPTNIAFAGDDLDVLVLASLGGSAVRALAPGVRGRRLHYPARTPRGAAESGSVGA